MATYGRPEGHKFCLDHLKEETTLICKTCKVHLCNECVASHKGCKIESIKKHAEGKYNVLLDFEGTACSHIKDIKDEEESADKDFEEVLQLIESRLKSTEDHGEYLKGLIDSHMLTTKTEYNTIRDSFKNHYQHYKSETGDALQTLNKLIKESKEAKKSDNDHLIVDVANDVASRKFSIPKYTKPEVNNFVCGSGPEKHIQSSFGYIVRIFMATPEVNKMIALGDPPFYIARTIDDRLIVTYGTNIISIVDRTGSIRRVESDVPIFDIAIHPPTGQMFCVHDDRKQVREVRSLNINTWKTERLFEIREPLDIKLRMIGIISSPVDQHPRCLAVSQQGHIIIAGKSAISSGHKIQLYTTEGAMLHNYTTYIDNCPRHITVCMLTGKIAIACERGGVMVRDDKYKGLYKITSGNFAEFDTHGHVIIGDLDTKSVRFYNAATGDFKSEIKSQLFQGKVQCLCTRSNGDLVVGTKGPNELQFIKYIQ